MKAIKLILGVSALALTTPVQAAQYLLTYTGTITTNDALGIFGPASFAKTNPRAYTAVFTIDDSIPGARFDETTTGTTGYNFGAASAAITGVLTIDGKSYTFGGSEAQFNTGFTGGIDIVSVLTGFEDDTLYTALSFDAGQFGAPISFRAPFAADAPAGLEALSAGSFTITDYNTALSSTGNATISRVTFEAAPGAVPEPATWAMILLGMGMVAGAARYRRRGNTVRYA